MDTLTLILSADQYRPHSDPADAAGTLRCGAIVFDFAIAAEHRLAVAELVLVEGDFSGQDLTVTFVNDAYGGTPATDRNLYLLGVYLNGLAVPVAPYPGNAMFEPHSTVVVVLPVHVHAAEPPPEAPVAEAPPDRQ